MGAPARLDEFFAAVPEHEALSALPDGVSVTFDLRGEGGGTWTVARQGGRTEIRRRAASNPDCHFRASVIDFRAFLRGELDARQGFLEGRFQVEGDVGLVLRLQRVAR